MADNQAMWIRKVKNRLREMYYDYSYRNINVLTIRGGSDLIVEMLRSDEPFLVGRLGSEESRTVRNWMKGRSYSKRNYHNILFNAGVFPNDKDTMDRFCDAYVHSVSNADLILTWGCVGEADIIKRYAPPNVAFGRNGTFNFMFYDEPWTKALKGKRVLVIHPFVDTIRSQYEKRRLLFSDELLPEFKELYLIKAVLSNAGGYEDLEYKSWFEALEHMKNEIDKIDFDVALVGAGAYGMPLSAYCKRRGKQAIYMGGGLQILFGIRGRRWDNTPQFVPYFNEYWIYPDENETPKQKEAVEGGSYWR